MRRHFAVVDADIADAHLPALSLQRRTHAMVAWRELGERYTGSVRGTPARTVGTLRFGGTVWRRAAFRRYSPAQLPRQVTACLFSILRTSFTFHTRGNWLVRAATTAHTSPSLTRWRTDVHLWHSFFCDGGTHYDTNIDL